jgi:hypothetical protein
VRANGGDGAPGCGIENEQGGTGGGSGGGILLEASILDAEGATLEARGGNGGLNGALCGAFAPHCGITEGGAGADNSSDPGDFGINSKGGGPGGGGGYGCIFTITK